MIPVRLACIGSLFFALCMGACGSTSTPDGSCYTDFDCEADQLCGREGVCLLCDNCARGRIGTCLAPVFPIEREPDSIRLDPQGENEVLVYLYTCSAGSSEFRYTRRPPRGSRPRDESHCPASLREPRSH